jgi:uncharacterized protein
MYGEGLGLSRKRRSGAADAPAAAGPAGGGAILGPMALDPLLSAKKEAALGRLRAAGRVAVALSGGVDSAVLLALAAEALGAANVLSLTGRSPAVPEAEIEDARRVATQLGVAHEVVPTSEMDRPGYRANAGDRSYHCRSELFDVFAEFASLRGIDTLA